MMTAQMVLSENNSSHLLVTRLFRVAEILVRQAEQAETADSDAENGSQNHDCAEIGYREAEDTLGIP